MITALWWGRTSAVGSGSPLRGGPAPATWEREGALVVATHPGLGIAITPSWGRGTSAVGSRSRLRRGGAPGTWDRDHSVLGAGHQRGGIASLRRLVHFFAATRV